jgi:enoyl-[acyl-carrier-protein] reductase (NADH)
MSKKKLTPKYNDNKSIRTKIDKLLEQNAKNVANSGTGSKLDVGDDSKVKEAWERIQAKIKEIDPVFYDIIKER